MKPEMTDRSPFTVIGIVTRVQRGTETPELFADVWSRFESRRRELQPVSISREYYGVSFATADETVTDYLAGIEVLSTADAVEGMQKRSIPAGCFAVFESPLAGIGACYREIFTAWLPSSGLALDPGLPVFEEYPDATPAEPVRIHVPVRRPATES